MLYKQGKQYMRTLTRTILGTRCRQVDIESAQLDISGLHSGAIIIIRLMPNIRMLPSFI